MNIYSFSSAELGNFLRYTQKCTETNQDSNHNIAVCISQILLTLSAFKRESSSAESPVSASFSNLLAKEEKSGIGGGTVAEDGDEDKAMTKTEQTYTSVVSSAELRRSHFTIKINRKKANLHSNLFKVVTSICSRPCAYITT